MRTSLNEVKEIEAYLFQEIGRQDKLLFDAKLILDSKLRSKTRWQRLVYRLVRLYGRKQLRQELEEVHEVLFNNNRHMVFKQQILAMFPKDSN